MTEIPNSVDNVPSHHRGAQGRDFAGRKHSGGSGAVAAAGGWCSWLRTGLSRPCGAVQVGDCWIMLATVRVGGSLVVRLPVALGAGVPVGLWVLRGGALGFALSRGLRVAGGGFQEPERQSASELASDDPPAFSNFNLKASPLRLGLCAGSRWGRPQAVACRAFLAPASGVRCRCDVARSP